MLRVSRIVLAALTTFVVLGHSAFAAIPVLERQMLVDLYTQSNGSVWTVNTGWNGAAGTECTWYGVTCDAGQNHVTGIVLPLNNMTGAINPMINLLPALTKFEVQLNQIAGTIPSLSGLVALERFDVSGNLLVGSIPSLTGLTALRRFWVASNKLTGSFPDLSGLSALETFSVSDNKLTGNLPSLSGLAALQSLRLYNNQLSGSLPSFAGLLSLRSIVADSNLFTGSIPALTGLTGLEEIQLSFNKLSGSIPSLSGLSALKGIYLSDNQLTGSIPPLAGLNALTSLLLRNNKLTGNIPALSGLAGLVTLTLDNNQLSGSIPALSDAPALGYFSVENNQLSGVLPDISGLPALQGFRVKSNQLNGAVPTLPVPNNLGAGSSSLCPNYLTVSANAGWDAATGSTPWSTQCQLITVTPSAAVHGSISPGSAQFYTLSSRAMFTVTPDAGYLASMSGTCGGTLVGTTFTSAPLTGNCTVVATFYPVGTLRPGAPSITSMSAGNASIAVAFVPPTTDGGSPIVNYTATCQGMFVAQATTLTATGTTSPLLVTGLVNGVQHRCKVSARNVAGSSESGYAIAGTPLTAPLPGPAVNVQAVPEDAAITLSFLPPDSTGLPITSYVATCEQSDASVTPSQVVSRSVNGASSPLTVNALTNLVPANCFVQPQNANGFALRAFAQVVTLAPKPAGVPSQLIFFGLSVPTLGNATLAFSPPLLDGGSPILDYQITSNLVGASAGPASTFTGDTTTLNLGTTGTFLISVSARNANGLSAPSTLQLNAATLTGSAAPVSAPTNLLGVPGNGSVTLSFTPPVNALALGVTSYTATCVSDIPRYTGAFVTSTTQNSTSGAASPLVVTGLTGDVNRCKVTNVGGTGGGAATAIVSVSAVGPKVLPDKPVVTAVTAGNGSVTVTFVQPPATGVSGVSDYQLRCFTPATASGPSFADGAISSTSTVRSTSTSLTMSGLTNGRTYGCQVRATNVVIDSTVSIAAPGDFASITATPAAQGGSAAGGTVFNGLTATGSGQSTLALPASCATCVIAKAKLVAVTGAPDSPSAPPPIGTVFPHGIVDFQVAGVSVGGTITVTLTYPQPLAAGSTFWKFGPRLGNLTPSWYQYPATFSGNTISYDLTDGGAGDGDLMADGKISDPAGLGAIAPPVLNVDDSTDAASKYDAATDGLLIVRYLLGLRGDALIQNARSATARRDAQQIADYLDSVLKLLDVDGDGSTRALTDGLLIVRRMMSLQGSALTSGANNSTKSAADIAAAIDALRP